jgi:hypothetical protein
MLHGKRKFSGSSIGRASQKQDGFADVWGFGCVENDRFLRLISGTGCSD